SVAFAATELWPGATAGGDRVILDLWERYLEPA
ncbi:SH3-like domain-containing protein, partial [Bauldia litoralis]